MQILESNVPEPKFDARKALFITGGITFSAALITPLLLIAIGAVSTSRTGTYLSPLPQGEISSSQPTPPPTPTVTFASALNLSQNYLDKAYLLSKNPSQTEKDKQSIIATLNLSLTQTNTAINLSPKDPRGYLMRAKVLTAMSKVNPETLKQVKQDLEIAQKLSNGEETTLPAPINPINLIPEQQASLAQNILIAAPEATSSPSVTKEGSNANITTITLPAKQSELVVTNPSIKESSYVYLIPKTKSSATVFVKSKASGTFTIGSTSPSDIDLSIDYWVINE